MSSRRLPQHVRAAVTALLLGGLTLPALSATPAAAGPPPLAAPPAGGASASATVTLVTGDEVTVDAPAADGPAAVSVTPRSGSGTRSFTTLRDGDDVYVVPDDAAGLVPEVLDLELFNVTALVEMGYDDASTRALPLIVQGPRPLAAAGEAAREDALPLPALDAVAVELPKKSAGTFAATLARPAGPAAAGVRRVWLDRSLEAAELDGNLSQIGAPEVWDAGLSGAGVDVAVLDSGVDADHPDLRGRVAGAADFTGEGTTEDRNGHGTHVASLVAGSGAASGGARKGVAYGARLLSGRVLNGEGEGRASWVIAGMQWATEQGADVVNLSLGGTAPEYPENDPVARALDTLAADTGTLFVVAAGNSGPYSGTIGTPGVAESALTVGAADADGGTPRFTSIGPTTGAFLSKPDLTAPGVAVTGARAGGGTADPYTEMSGTSQATPHVAGAAALLLQKHPDWDWRRLKTALMTTADGDAAAPRPHAAGAGVLDLPGAANETLQLDRGNVDFGYLRYPEGERPASIELTLTNDGTEPRAISLTDLATERAGAPLADDAVTVTPAAVTVAPGATERVTVTLTPGGVAPGVYSGAVVLTENGHDTVTLPLSFYLEPPRHDVDLTVLDRNGRPWAGGSLWLLNMRETYPETGGGFRTVHLDENGRATARMLPGPLSMLAKVETPAADGDPATVAFAGSPEVMLDGDMAYTIDARKALPLRPATVEGADTRVRHASVHYARHDEGGTDGLDEGIYATGEEIEQGRVFLQPTEPVRHGSAAFVTRWRLEGDGKPQGRNADVYELVLGRGETIPDPPSYRVTRAEARRLARVEADYRSLLGRDDTYTETREARTDGIQTAFAYEYPLAVPQRRVEMVTARPDVSWRHCVLGPEPALPRLCAPTLPYEPGESAEPVWYGAPAPAVIAGLHYGDQLDLPVSLSDGEHQGSIWNSASAGNESLRLFRDGAEVPVRPGTSYFPVTPEPATYRLEHTSRPDREALPIGSETRTSWTFPARGPADPLVGQERVRLLGVDYAPRTDRDGAVPAYRPLTVGLRLTSTAGPEDAIRTERGSVRFWASTDGGERWHEALVAAGRGGELTALVPGVWPRPGQEVSVRVRGTAAEGRAIEQTITDAYRAG
ncbi:S8 family serine peptidase [Streptomyces sp. NBC_01808]|uniref:S8 family peptidase n=1 Tax=Streptomyces sp. NBC_01808 TaxID=2975947 RepID=UPI002DDBAD8A|nr:S8 family serine peptidase [Streptomyces sp. NBC_01808]WSA36507.1 S8 family serine peptidase [Streptomyces sp. NBC_01808]